MPVSLKHTTEAVGTDAGNGEIGKTQWNEEHALTGTPDSLLGFDADGDADETPKTAFATSAQGGLADTALQPGDNVSELMNDAGFATLTGIETLTNKTLTDAVLTGYSETVFALTGTTPAIDASNGTIQTWVLSGNSTPTDSLASGESVLLMIDDGSARTVTWTMVDVWTNNGGAAPTLKTTGFTHVLVWKVSTTVYGALIGDPA